MIRDVFCTLHLSVFLQGINGVQSKTHLLVLGSDSKIHLKTRFLARFTGLVNPAALVHPVHTVPTKHGSAFCAHRVARHASAPLNDAWVAVGFATPPYCATFYYWMCSVVWGNLWGTCTIQKSPSGAKTFNCNAFELN